MAKAEVKGSPDKDFVKLGDSFSYANPRIPTHENIDSDVSLKLEEFSIYERWGTKIFSTENISKGWDGTINGKQQKTGAYVYTIKGTNEKGRIFLKGSFILIR